MISYRFLSAAEDEIAESILFYNEISLELGKDFLASLDRAIGLLRSSPLIGSPIDNEFRTFALRRFPFGVIYKLEIDEIVIIAVAHQSRKPGYWSERI